MVRDCTAEVRTGTRAETDAGKRAQLASQAKLNSTQVRLEGFRGGKRVAHTEIILRYHDKVANTYSAAPAAAKAVRDELSAYNNHVAVHNSQVAHTSTPPLPLLKNVYVGQSDYEGPVSRNVGALVTADLTSTQGMLTTAGFPSLARR